MTPTIYVKGTEPWVREIVQACYPDYEGTRDVQIHTRAENEPFKLWNDYWSEGSRSYWAAYSLERHKGIELPSINPLRQLEPQIDPVNLGPDVLMVELKVRGVFKVPVIHAHPNAIDPRLLPVRTEITWAEKVVLLTTRSRKSSYAGIKDFRFSEAKRETGITWEEWEAAKSALIERKLLSAIGAITASGRNAVEGLRDLYQLRRKVG